MSLPRNVSQIISNHVTLEVESIDRMYLNLYVPKLQCEQGAVSFFRYHRGEPLASSSLMAEMTRAFVADIEAFAANHDIPLILFEKRQRKDDIAAQYRASFTKEEGILFIGKAQEKASLFRTQKRHNPKTGNTYAWIVRSTAMVNYYYIYAIDRDFGPFFIKFCSYFPYNAKLCINGHEYLKQQLKHQAIDFLPLDNGILSCNEPQVLQQICNDLSAERIDQFARKWFHLLPHPFTATDRQAGFRYDISILQAEFSLTQVLDRPLTGRTFFEQVIHENLNIGSPGQVQLIFNRRVTSKTPGRFRTRVITEGVTPSLHVDYKHSKIKQYHKEGRALRTETTINDTRDFSIGKRLKNLPALREVGFAANRRLLNVQQLSHDCAIGEEAFNQVQKPAQLNGQRVSAIRFGDETSQALLHAITFLSLLPQGFRHKELKERFAQLLGIDTSHITQGMMTYQLRRMRLRGLIDRLEGTHKYRVTDFGLRVALLYTRTYSCVLRPGLSQILSKNPPADAKLRIHFDRLTTAVADWCRDANLAA